MAKEISGRGRRRSPDEKGNQGVGDFLFINILQLFLFMSFFQLLLLYQFFYTFLTHDIYPHPHPHTRPTTSTHYPRPMTFSYTPEKSCVQRWYTVIANITAKSLNFWLIKLVKGQSLIFCNTQFSACVILKEC